MKAKLKTLLLVYLAIFAVLGIVLLLMRIFPWEG